MCRRWLFLCFPRPGTSACGRPLTVSSADVVRCVGDADPRGGAALAPYPLGPRSRR